MDDLSRTLMTLSCNDCDGIPKVADAGRIVREGGKDVQVMHNGLRVVAGGYHGDWMAHIIRGLRGHHEPQEEFVFYNLLRFVRHNSLIVELGAFWAYYTLWFLQEIPGSRAICVEPDLAHLQIGRCNAALNGMSDRIEFVEGWVGGRDTATLTQVCETIKTPRTLPCFDISRLLQLTSLQPIELLHLDVQGAETPFLYSMIEAGALGSVRFVVVSTHHASISGSPTTHQDCIRILEEMGARILVEHDVQSSYSGDGLIVASLFAQDNRVVLPEISRNNSRKSLFPV